MEGSMKVCRHCRKLIPESAHVCFHSKKSQGTILTDRIIELTGTNAAAESSFAYFSLAYLGYNSLKPASNDI
jgi:hypothetical protein